jgi:hypothetical protein
MRLTLRFWKQVADHSAGLPPDIVKQVQNFAEAAYLVETWMGDCSPCFVTIEWE